MEPHRQDVLLGRCRRHCVFSATQLGPATFVLGVGEFHLPTHGSHRRGEILRTTGSRDTFTLGLRELRGELFLAQASAGQGLLARIPNVAFRLQLLEDAPQPTRKAPSIIAFGEYNDRFANVALRVACKVRRGGREARDVVGVHDRRNLLAEDRRVTEGGAKSVSMPNSGVGLSGLRMLVRSHVRRRTAYAASATRSAEGRPSHRVRSHCRGRVPRMPDAASDVARSRRSWRCNAERRATRSPSGSRGGFGTIGLRSRRRESPVPRVPQANLRATRAPSGGPGSTANSRRKGLAGTGEIIFTGSHSAAQLRRVFGRVRPRWRGDISFATRKVVGGRHVGGHTRPSRQAAQGYSHASLRPALANSRLRSSRTWARPARVSRLQRASSA
mmetsp:Transcript_90497/g.255464  ORF Transcript_90497/g.255464 Transcript_90497/m.255464 type:complete len:387 (-) Transcript_90497:150-1310(-)